MSAECIWKQQRHISACTSAVRSGTLNPCPAEPGYTLPLQTVKIQISWLLWSQLIWICTVCHSECEFISTIWIKESDWLKTWKGCGILIYSAGQGLLTHKASITTAADKTLKYKTCHFMLIICIADDVREHRVWHFMWIVCLADVSENKAWHFMWNIWLVDDSQEKSNLIFFEK